MLGSQTLRTGTKGLPQLLTNNLVMVSNSVFYYKYFVSLSVIIVVLHFFFFFLQVNVESLQLGSSICALEVWREFMKFNMTMYDQAKVDLYIKVIYGLQECDWYDNSI